MTDLFIVSFKFHLLFHSRNDLCIKGSIDMYHWVSLYGLHSLSKPKISFWL